MIKEINKRIKRINTISEKNQEKVIMVTKYDIKIYAHGRFNIELVTKKLYTGFKYELVTKKMHI